MVTIKKGQTDGRSVPHQTDLRNQSLCQPVGAKVAEMGGVVYRRSICPQLLRLRECSMEGGAKLEAELTPLADKKRLKRLCRHRILEFGEHF